MGMTIDERDGRGSGGGRSSVGGGAPARVTVRGARAADADRIALAHVRAWQAAYVGLMPTDYLDGLDVDRRAVGWSRYLAAPPPPDQGLAVVVVDRVVGGFATFGESRDVGTAGVGELYAINLHPDVWGVGAGSVLLRHAHDGLAEMGYAQAVLWVVPGNVRARRSTRRTAGRLRTWSEPPR